jgi:hypothetical protein
MSFPLRHPLYKAEPSLPTDIEVSRRQNITLGIFFNVRRERF